MKLYFKLWIERLVTGGEPPKESPVDPNPAPGQTDALFRYNRDDKPPVPRYPMIKKKMKSQSSSSSSSSR